MTTLKKIVQNKTHRIKTEVTEYILKKWEKNIIWKTLFLKLLNIQMKIIKNNIYIYICRSLYLFIY